LGYPPNPKRKSQKQKKSLDCSPKNGSSSGTFFLKAFRRFFGEKRSFGHLSLINLENAIFDKNRGNLE
jgi:hypothetical protein